MSYFEYGQKELDHLASRDPRMAGAIATLGIIQRETTPDPLAALAFSIIAQQISGKAAETITRRFQTLIGGTVTEDAILACSPEEIKSCGMSLRKATFIHRIASVFKEEQFSRESLLSMDDAELLRTLTAMPGVGPWTAEMLMIFSLQRPDVLSWGDFGIRKGLMLLHGLESIDKKQFAAFQKLYSPHCSIASFYLWAITGGEYQPAL